MTTKIRHNGAKPTKLKSIVREIRAVEADVKKAAQAEVDRVVADANEHISKAQQRVGAAEDMAGQMIQRMQRAEGERDAAQQSHTQALAFLVRATAEGAAALVALKHASGHLREDADPQLVAGIEAAIKGQNGAAFVGMLSEAQQAVLALRPYVDLAHEMAEALRCAQHELDTTHGLVAFDGKAPGETMELVFGQALHAIGGVLEKYRALVEPKAEEAAATVTRIPGVEHTAECTEGMDAGHGCACHGHDGPELPKLEPSKDDPSKWVIKGETKAPDAP